MHACWVLLTASGEIPARILHVRPPLFVSKDRPLVSEVDLSSSEFPLVRANVGAIEPTESFPPADVETALQQLGIVGDHPAVRKALEVAATLANSTAPILILGETGTGKELFARFIHRLSGRPPESVCCTELRRTTQRPGGKHTLRPQTRRVSWSDERSSGEIRSGGRRDALS